MKSELPADLHLKRLQQPDLPGIAADAGLEEEFYL